MKKILLILSLVIGLLLVTACSNDSSTDNYDGSEEPWTAEDAIEDDNVSDGGMTLEEAKDAEGSFFIKKGDVYFEPTYPEIVDADSTSINREAYNQWGMGINFVLNKEEENIPLVMDDNTQLVNVDQFNGIKATNIKGETGYTIPHLFSNESQGWQMWQEQYGNAYHGTITAQISEIREINGKEPGKILSKCINCYMESSLGYDIDKMLPMKKNETITLGAYSGTDFKEISLTAEYSYFIPDDRKYTELACSETREGYGLIDTNDLSAGLYCFEDNSSGLRHYFWLEIE